MKQSENNKRKHGQYFTVNNAFSSPGFIQWLKLTQCHKGDKVLEPFAGACHIPYQLEKMGINFSWECFDISPPKETVDEKYKVIKRNVLKNFPKKHKLIITNPPYLAKNSAHRRGLPFPDTKYDDLFLLCLNTMLNHVEFVGAIIPESFLNKKYFKNRLWGIISLKDKLFEDTECPVCLALFVPEKIKEKSKDDFKIWDGQKYLGFYSEFENMLSTPSVRQRWRFNDKTGTIALVACDNNKNPSIKFLEKHKSNISSDEIKISSRARTLIKNTSNIKDCEVVEEANKILNNWRIASHDLFLTPFKGLRCDLKWRRRLDFKSAKVILDLAVETIILKNKVIN